jgi:hypothetical protein
MAAKIQVTRFAGERLTGRVNSFLAEYGFGLDQVHIQFNSMITTSPASGFKPSEAGVYREAYVTHPVLIDSESPPESP